ncbi:non-heme iron oxygenase ferredoxin subunit [Pinisolibacter sp.]|uniref:non-heme iron oxygenase ferredoxin subunit n=1 Tax=Pinisolibacter sp. TaxID=2172024 RepID=UPI003FA796AA
MLRVDTDNGLYLAVFNVDGEYYVTDNVCTHGVAMLTDGWLEDETIECPQHGGCFDVRTGKATAFPCEKPLKTYAVIRDGDDLLVDVGEGK